MATVKDVAREAGVSAGTVSRYLNGAELKEVNRIRIEEAIKKLNFKLNPIARTLKTSKTYTIGIIIPNLSDIYSTTIVRNIEEELYEYGYNIFVCDTWGRPELERDKAAILLDKMVDGLIIYPCGSDISYLNEVMEREIPVVTIDGMASGKPCDQILTDNIGATYAATEWLISKNHKRIGIITGNEDFFTAGERLKGYKRALEDYSIKIEEELIKTIGMDEKAGYEALRQLVQLQEPPSAILACNYYTTLGAVKATYDFDIKVPEQMSFIGFDNLGLSEIARPALSIIIQPMEQIGRRAAQILLKRIKGDYEGFPSISRLKTEFVERDSTKTI